MSINCKISGFTGRVPANYKLKKSKETVHESHCVWKWRRVLLSLWFLGGVFGFLWFSSSFNYAAWRGKEKTPNLFEEKGRIWLQHFNVSKNKLRAWATWFSEADQIGSAKCATKLTVDMAPSNSIACVMKVLCTEKQAFEKQHECFQENDEPKDQCSVREEIIPWKSDLSLLGDKSVSFVSQSTASSIFPGCQNNYEKVLQARAVVDGAKEHCESVSFCLVNITCWVLLGVIVTCKTSSFHVQVRRNRKENLVQEKPMMQQKQMLQQKQQELAQGPSKGAGKWRKKLLVVFVIGGLIGSIWLFCHLNNDIIMRRTEMLINMCDERARMLQDQFNVSMNHVHALAILISTFHHGKSPSAIDQKTFREYTERTAFERPLTSGVAYALKVLHSEREQFEKEHGWTIKKMENEDQTLVQDCNPDNLDPSPVRDEYAPVIFSQETVSHIVSIDMMSGKEDRNNILRARASGKGVLTSPFKLLKSNHLGVVLTFAVYGTDLPADVTPQQRIEATVGYLGASYDVPSLVEKLLHQLASKQTIDVNVYDTTNASAPINMYGPEVIDTGALHISSLDFGDPSRKHEMCCRFKQKPPPPWTAIIASVGALVITLLLGHIFHAAINRIAKVENDYRKMMELKVRAEAADVAKSQFLATVSHEIRTPMNGVLGMLQMLMDTDLDANQLDFAQTAHDSGKDLISLINEVLDQAKIESGRLELEAVPFDMRSVLDNVFSLFSGRSHEKGIELAVYVSEQVPEVVIGDPGRFRQIITNLVGNSIKFTRNKGHIFVSVHLADEARDRHDVKDEVLRQSLTLVQDRSNNTHNTLSGFPVVDRWKNWENFKKLSCTNSAEEPEIIKLLVTVEDTGIGIPHDAQGRIFTPFMQADSSTSRTHGGTGIGLSISKCLVDLMHGEIGFVSEPGIGSSFSFYAAFREGDRKLLDSKQQSHNPAVSEFQGLRALVVDERRIRAEVTRYHLQRLGISVDMALSLKCASVCISSICKASAFTQLAMILVDEDVWDKDTGLAFQHLIQEIRLNGRIEASDIPLKIFLLANSISPSKRSKIKSAGVVDNVLLKPLRLSILVACFHETHGIGEGRQLSRGKPTTLGNLLNEKQILVVDDNLVNRRVAEGALKKYGAVVTCVDSGKAALEMLRPPHNFDACFMDLQMPEMDGFEATLKIRYMESKANEKIVPEEASTEMSTNVGHWHTPILAMTADVIQATNGECMKCGMDGYVSKPFEEGQLYSAVARFFESD
ncbi:histidine kinase 2 [Malania oleifera]|uniref:histidine kinase 2 n=1 Tax=Malania oleifera TaxID=397392 RepID=UPI0025AE7F10|nr:histidine kinase 2 [Malania oleifera]XP_057955519.1 histidine kinase 2 [Malania oleifera]XP_057955520.1 histidine kinase 2 [Malania oleifera]XP_057955521.1 histidine kinase 2 [Malania oleifera]